MIFTEERWRDARNVASLPIGRRPTVFNKLPTKKRAQYKPTNEQSLAAAALAPDVLKIVWKDTKAKTLHLNNLREQDQTGWQADSKGTTYPTCEMIFTEERWRDARNVASLPIGHRPAVFTPPETKKVNADYQRAKREEGIANGVFCRLCPKPCGSYSLEEK
jgi:hypothetical protein